MEDDFPLAKTRIVDAHFDMLDRAGDVLARVPLAASSHP
jgi:hypothetical protein